MAGMPPFRAAIAWLFGPGPSGNDGYLYARWLLLRAIALIYYSAFYSLLFQVRGLIGPDGILPAGSYLQAIARQLSGVERYWFAPTLLWLGSGDFALQLLCWTGMIAAALLLLNLWPRMMLLVCWLAYLSFVAAAQDFASYQSDGMLLEAGFICLFFAPPGLRPGVGLAHPPSRASLWLLRWEWFRIYFESGLAKMLSHEVQWRNFTAMDEYYQNGPLPTWIGWYAQHLPHGFHAATVAITLGVELALVWLVFAPRRVRFACFLMVTPFEAGIILTANYTFLNYLVLSLGVLLLDDRVLGWCLHRFRRRRPDSPACSQVPVPPDGAIAVPAWRNRLRATRLATAALALSLVAFATTAQLLWMLWPRLPLPAAPVQWLQPFRIANSYGLFAVMTRARYEIEFQGSDDGNNWVAYPFRYKPQDLSKPPGIYAPYQPRFDWNLWFASLGNWRDNLFVVRTEELLLLNDSAVLSLLAGNPFPRQPPRQVRAVLWQYWFTDLPGKHSTGNWWRREFLGLYAPAMVRLPDGSFAATAMPGILPPPP
jgi:lipase maturation factor 1